MFLFSLPCPTDSYNIHCLSILQITHGNLEAISKIGFWFKIAAGRILNRRLLVVEDLKRGTNPAEKGGRPKDIFEMASNYFRQYVELWVTGLFYGSRKKRPAPKIIKGLDWKFYRYHDKIYSNGLEVVLKSINLLIYRRRFSAGESLHSLEDVAFLIW